MPYWASSLVKSATIGNHIFYRWRGGWGRPPAFASRYAGVEPAIAWRGGFGQPSRSETQLAAESSRDAAAAAAAAEAAPLMGSVDSFQRAVLRRYEPLQRDTANAVITERANAGRRHVAQPALGADRQRWRSRRTRRRSAAGTARPSSRASCRACAIAGIRRPRSGRGAASGRSGE